MLIIQVILPIPVVQYLHYVCPKNKNPIIGSRVIVPLRNKHILGIIIHMFKVENFNSFKLKQICAVLDTKSIFTKTLWDLILWCTDYYHSAINVIIFSNIPRSLKKGKVLKSTVHYQWIITQKGNMIKQDLLKKTPKQLKALLILKKTSIFSHQLTKYGVSKYILNKLYIKKLCFMSKVVQIKSAKINQNNINGMPNNLLLNIHDILNLKKILTNNKKFMVNVIIGTSNVVKREVYLILLLEIFRKGFKVLIIVPNQYIMFKLKKYLGNKLNLLIEVYHSQLSDQSQLLIWKKSKSDNPMIIISTYKGVFLPLFRLGMIIIDEENNVSYKIFNIWKYNVKHVAIARAYREKIPIFLESTAPSLETLYNISKKKYTVIHINSKYLREKVCRLNSMIIDLNNQRTEGVFSKRLIEYIYYHLNNRNQVCFIVNNLEFMYTVLQCKICLSVVKCYKCNQFYKFNAISQELYCNNCLVMQCKKPIICMFCRSVHFSPIKFNMELIQENIKSIFFKIPVFVMNTKTAHVFKKASYDDISYYVNPCIIIGNNKEIMECTFRKVTLIAFINVDFFFYSPNFQAIEYFGQLYSSIVRFFKAQNLSAIQMIVQTTISNNIFLNILINEGYENFSSKLLENRKKYNLPPFSSHVVVQAESKKDSSLINFLLCYRDKIVQFTQHNQSIELWTVGPYPVLFNKYRKRFYSKIMLIHPSRAYIKYILNQTIVIINTIMIKKDIFISFDLDTI